MIDTKTEDIRWSVVKYWDYSLTSTLAWGGVLFTMVVLTMMVIGVLLESGLPIYLGLVFAFLSFLLWVAGSALAGKKAPKRVGYSSNTLYLQYSDREERISFRDIERARAHRNIYGGIFIRDIDGNNYYLGPGLGGPFGRSFIETFSEWIDTETERTAQIRERTIGRVPKLRVIEAEVQ